MQGVESIQFLQNTFFPKFLSKVILELWNYWNQSVCSVNTESTKRGNWSLTIKLTFLPHWKDKTIFIYYKGTDKTNYSKCCLITRTYNIHFIQSLITYHLWKYVIFRSVTGATIILHHILIPIILVIYFLLRLKFPGAILISSEPCLDIFCTSGML